mgnify:CR=1 FL=1
MQEAQPREGDGAAIKPHAHFLVVCVLQAPFFCQLSVVLVPLRLLEEGNRPEGITAALRAPVVVAVCVRPVGGHAQ